MAGLRAWWRERRLARRARRLLDSLFDRGDLIGATSLRPRHRARAVVVGFDTDPEGGVRVIRFGILRHPRPYAFSPQAHRVVEYWRWTVPDGIPERLRGVNLTRREGRDAD